MWLKWTKRILAGIGITIVLVIAFAISVIYIYEDEVKQFAVEQLNKNLKVKVKAPQIDLTLWDQFPQASLRFTDVLIPDYLSPDGTDTMFYAKHIYLSFDFWDMMGGNYKVQTVSMENAKINLFINEEGQENYDIFKEDTLETEESKFSFQLKEVTGKEIAINYVDSLTRQFYHLYSPEIAFAGDFSEKEFRMKVNSELSVDKVKTNDVTFIRNKKATLDLELNINNTTSTYDIHKGEVTIEELLFEVIGFYKNIPDSSWIDLNIKGKNIDLSSAFTIFPKEYLAPLEKYKAKGLVVFESKIEGPLSTTETPHTTADFYLKDGSLTELTSMVSMKDLSLDGYYDSDKNGISVLELNEIKGTIDVGQINGTVLVENLSMPKVTASANGEINLLQLKNFANTPNIEKLAGNATFDASFIGEQKGDEFKILKSNGVFSFDNAALKLPTSAINYTQIRGKLILNQNDAAITDFRGFASDSDFKLDGVIRNLIPYIISNQEILTVEADLRTEKLNLDQLISTDPVSSGMYAAVDPEPGTFNLPNNINLNLKSQIEELNYGKFTATKVNGIITLFNQKLSAKNFTFKANKGTYICTTDFSQNPDLTFTWSTGLTASGIDIESFFFEMDNFGQEYITDQNIKGKGDIDLNMAVLLGNDLSIFTESLIADISINLTKGELVQQSSLLDIGAYLDGNKLIKMVIDTERLLTKMEHVKFSDLSNTISIKDSKIFIPKMTIASNVMDLSLAGVHGFDDVVDYHFTFTLRDLYYNNKKQEEFGPVIDDELGAKIFLHMFGSLDNPEYEIDSEEKQAQLKQSIEQEKKDVKSLLKSELGLFKKDTTVKDYQAPEKVDPTFEIEWEEFDKNESEEDSNPSDPKNKDKPKKDKDKGLNKLLKKLGVEEEEKKDVQIKIEQ